MNEDVLATRIKEFCQETNLVEVIETLHGPAETPTHQHGSKAINRIFISPQLAEGTQGSFLNFGNVTISNH